MSFLRVTSLLALAGQALGHGYVWRVDADNTAYPGWDPRVDPYMNPLPARIAYGGGNVSPVMNQSSNDIACSYRHAPAPATIAKVRAGASVSFHWSHWLHSHKGPITAWLAPYEGDVKDVDVNKLSWFMSDYDAVDDKGEWATDRLMANDHVWTTKIPADIKPGKYLLRQEIMALHFTQNTSTGFEFAGVGPQFYLTCYNFEISGTGSSVPAGLPFPGAYQHDEPGLWYDVLHSKDPYPGLTAPLYKSAFDVELTPNEFVVLSPTGKGAEADEKYYAAQNKSLAQQVQINSFIDANGG